MSQKSYTHVRVSVETAQLLRAEARRLAAAAQAGESIAAGYQPEPINPECPGVSADAVIRWLLSRLARDRERVSRAKRKKKGDDDGASAAGADRPFTAD